MIKRTKAILIPGACFVFAALGCGDNNSGKVIYQEAPKKPEKFSFSTGGGPAPKAAPPTQDTPATTNAPTGDSPKAPDK